MFREGREMGIELVDILVDGVRLCGVALQVEGSPVPVGILIHDVAELIQEEIGGLRAAGEASPGELGARLKAREENLACRVGRGADDGLRGLDLARRKAVGAVGRPCTARL